MIRRILILLVVLGVLGFVILLAFEIVSLDFVGFMEDQLSIGHQEGPRRLPPAEAVPLSRPAYLDQPQALVNPVPSDDVSLQRGEILYGFHCAACHGQTGQGNGSVVEFWRDEARRPANLTEARFSQYPDGTLYRIVTHGIGGMPPLRENLTERQRWDVINYLRTLQP
jgi:mono/diheme cytochrome c family protein